MKSSGKLGDRVPAVRARTSSETFGEVVALDGVDLDVDEGRSTAWSGPNGAGKTTLLGLLLGLAVADSGRLEILGTPVGRTLAVPDGVAGLRRRTRPLPLAHRPAEPRRARRRCAGTTPGAAGIDDALEQVGLDRRRRRPGPRLLAGHAPAARARRRAAHRAAAARARRAGQRPRPGRQAPRAPRAHRARRGRAPRWSCPATGWTTSRRCAPRSPSSPPAGWSSPGPVGKLAAESGELDYRLRTSDPAAARRLAPETPGLRVAPGRRRRPAARRRRSSSAAPVPALDELVARLVGAGVARARAGAGRGAARGRVPGPDRDRDEPAADEDGPR